MTNIFGAVLALLGGLVWGGGDFVGGLASRRANSLHVLVVGGAAGSAALTILAMLWGEGWPDSVSVFYGALAGLAGLLGLSMLYRGLAAGKASVVAPVSTILSQALPVLYAIGSSGWPKATQIAGFMLAIAGCALVSRGHAADGAGGARSALLTGIVSGAGFGIFLIVISWTSDRHVFGSLVAARGALIVVALSLIALSRQRVTAAALSASALVAGVLDAGGNALYLLARQFTRLDIAVVLGSLYPVSTILLSRIFLREHVAAVQWVGIVLCAIAVALIVF
jgi:drug/metabolite transporter (DMT)-like permease